MIEIHGFVIVPPINKWDELYKDKIWIDSSSHTFGKTEVQAWRRFIGPIEYGSISFEDRIYHWFSRGYKLKKAKLEIYEE